MAFIPVLVLSVSKLVIGGLVPGETREANT